MRRPPATLRDVFAMRAALMRRLPAAHRLPAPRLPAPQQERPILLRPHQKLPELQPDPRGCWCFPAAGHQEKEVHLDQSPPHH